jgi:hypothetical protein
MLVYHAYVIRLIDVRGSFDSIDREIARLAEENGQEAKPWKATIRRFGTTEEIPVKRQGETEARAREHAQKFIDFLRGQA